MRQDEKLHFANVRPVIMSGGAGTRLWPLSRKSRPKQFIELAGKKSLFAQVLHRVSAEFGFLAPTVVGNVDHRFLMAEVAQEEAVNLHKILLEPFGRNTAAAIAAAALVADADEILLVLPSDHVVRDLVAFHRIVEEGAKAATTGKMVCFGITPDYPETGYGYIEAGDPLEHVPGVHGVASFREKPDAATAQSYIDSGRYAWNSGMFMFKASAIIAEMDAHVPGLVKAVKAALDAGEEDIDFLRLDPDAFGAVEDISIDYGVMERTSEAATLAADIGWSDLGSYTALHKIGDADENGNVRSGDVLARDAKDNFLLSSHRLLAVNGVEDLAIVATDDVVMVTPKSADQDVKELVALLKADDREEASYHSTYFRPWGNYRSVAEGSRFQVKEIVVYPGKRLSLQLHHHRAEHWIIVEGTALVTRGEDQLRLTENQSVYIPLETKHRLENIGDGPLKLIEVQSGSYLGEDDIVRFDDDFGRKGTTTPL